MLNKAEVSGRVAKDAILTFRSVHFLNQGFLCEQAEGEHEMPIG